MSVILEGKIIQCPACGKKIELGVQKEKICDAEYSYEVEIKMPQPDLFDKKEKREDEKGQEEKPNKPKDKKKRK